MSTALVPYTPREPTWEEQFAHIVAQVASGRSVSSILRDDEGMPPPSTFWPKLYRDEALYAQISRAREFGVEAILEEIRTIADTPVEAIEIEDGVGPNGPYRKRSVKEALGHRRLQIETRLKYAQMIQPRYSEKMSVKHEGEISVRPSEELDDVARATRLAAMFKRMQERLSSADE